MEDLMVYFSWEKYFTKLIWKEEILKDESVKVMSGTQPSIWKKCCTNDS